MKCRLLTVLIISFSIAAGAQQNPALIDTFKAKIARAKTPEDKVEQLGSMAMVLMNTSITEADKYGELMIREAEISRKRPLMVKALLINAVRYSFFSMNKEFVKKSISYYNQALEIAKQNKLDKETVESLLGLASITTKIPDLDKSLSYTTQAFVIASSLNDDTLKVDSYNTLGDIYQRKKERLLALRNYLNGLRIAEEVKNHNYLRSCYSNLTGFYADIKEYDKAIDYAQKATEQLSFTTSGGKEYNRVIDLYGLGNLYVLKKNFEMSVYYFEESIRLADSLKYEPLKMPGYIGLLNQYIQAGQPEKALAYFNNRPDLKKYITNSGFGYVIDNAYGVIHTKLGNYDSARYYLDRAASAYETKTTPEARIGFYIHYGELFNKSGDVPKAIAYYTKVKALADGINNLESQQDASKELDSLYAKSGDFKQSHLYSNLYRSYKDSLQKLGEQKDLMQAELADEQQRQERIAREEAAALDRKHTVQYMGIAIAIGVIFILLVAMGLFRVSERTIKIMGFFSFILLFEFIILLADAKIHNWTHGEPLPVLGIKIILIAMLLPLHHWLEHKVVSYLASKRLIIPSGKSIWQSIGARKKIHKENVH